MFGLTIPKDGPFAGMLIEKIEDFVSALLLPLYFSSSGLKTNIATIHGSTSLGLLVLVTVIASAGKILGTYFVAIAHKVPFREAMTLGFLMNTKGLVELIVLNIGKDRKVKPKLHKILEFILNNWIDYWIAAHLSWSTCLLFRFSGSEWWSICYLGVDGPVHNIHHHPISNFHIQASKKGSSIQAQKNTEREARGRAQNPGLSACYEEHTGDTKPDRGLQRDSKFFPAPLHYALGGAVRKVFCHYDGSQGKEKWSSILEPQPIATRPDCGCIRGVWAAEQSGSQTHDCYLGISGHAWGYLQYCRPETGCHDHRPIP